MANLETMKRVEVQMLRKIQVNKRAMTIAEKKLPIMNFMKSREKNWDKYFGLEDEYDPL